MHIQVLTPSRYNAGHRTRTGITLRVFLQHVRLDRESARSGLISLVWGKNRENYSETPILDIKKRGGRQIIPMTISSQEASRMKVEHPTPMMGSQRSSCTWGSINIGRIRRDRLPKLVRDLHQAPTPSSCPSSRIIFEMLGAEPDLYQNTRNLQLHHFQANLAM